MFCVNCGAQLREGGNFCVSCGQRLSRPAAPATPVEPPPQPPPVYAPPAPPTAPVRSAAGTVKCSWCGEVVNAAASCPFCGATLDAAAVVTHSGWASLPGRKDMAKLQFGRSSCQIEGLYVPVADMNLAAGDGVYFSHHVLLWKDSKIDITAMSLRGAWKRLFGGLPLIMTQATGPGHIAFSKDEPGELIPIPLQPGQAIDVREHLFLAATHGVEYDWFNTNVWIQTRSGDETETHYPLGMNMDRFHAPNAPGLLLLHAGGNVFVRDLQPGQRILVKPTSLIFKDPHVQMHLHFEHPGGSMLNTGAAFFGLSLAIRYTWLALTGPGRVAIQSVFDRIEGEGRNMQNSSYATSHYW